MTFIVVFLVSGWNTTMGQSDSSAFNKPSPDTLTGMPSPVQSDSMQSVVKDSIHLVFKDITGSVSSDTIRENTATDTLSYSNVETLLTDSTSRAPFSDSVSFRVITSRLKDSSAIPLPVYLNVDKGPEYPGGQDSMIMYLVRNMVFPQGAAESGVSGLVQLRFIIDSTGRVCCYDAEAEPGGYEFEHEAVRLLMAMPPWIPALKDGQPVSVYYRIPVSFQYHED